MNPSIKFSHKYSKLSLGGDVFVRKAKLLEVISIDLNHLSSTFLNYDTDNGKYVFAPKKCNPMNILIFRSEATGMMFTTIRPITSDKFYRDNISKEFDILIKGRDYE